MQKSPKIHGIVLSLANVIFDGRGLWHRIFVGPNSWFPYPLADTTNASLQAFNFRQLLLKAFSTCPGIARLWRPVLQFRLRVGITYISLIYAMNGNEGIPPLCCKSQWFPAF
jgi:hypothetical protein